VTGLHAKNGEMKEPEDTADKRFYLDAGKSAVGHKRLSKV